MKRTIRLTESELRRMISESVRRLMIENAESDYFLNNNPGRRFTQDNNGKYSMDIQKDLEDGGIRHGSFSTTKEAWGKNGIQADYYKGKEKKKQEKNAKAADKRWKKSADSRKMHRKGSLNRAMDESVNIDHIIRESFRRVMNEAGNSKRGSYMMGRAANRNLTRGDVSGFIDKRDNASDKDAFEKGTEDQSLYGKHSWDDMDLTRDINNRKRLQNNYDLYKMEDMDNLGRKFIDFIEHYNGGVLMQTIVDYESGNQTGKKESPLKEIIPYFEEEVLGEDCTPEMVDAITKAYNQWWYYAEDQLMPYDE